MITQVSDQTGVGLLKIPDVARQLSLSVRSINYLMQQRRLPFLKIGGAVRFVQRDVDQFIEQHRIGGR